mgnify:CR=1 FL=1
MESHKFEQKFDELVGDLSEFREKLDQRIRDFMDARA